MSTTPDENARKATKSKTQLVYGNGSESLHCDIPGRLSFRRKLPVIIERNSDQIDRACQSITIKSVYGIEKPVLTESECREIQERKFMILGIVIENECVRVSFGHPGDVRIDRKGLRSAGNRAYFGYDRTGIHSSARSRATGKKTEESVKRTRSSSDGSGRSRSRSSSSNNKRSSGSNN